MANELWNDAIDRMVGRMEDSSRRVGERFPHWADTDTGDWTTTADGDWTGGFWVGMHWLAHQVLRRSNFGARAETLAERLRPRIAAQTVFKSFPIYYGAALGAILAERPRMRDLALECARTLVAAYQPTLGLIPLGAEAEEGAHIGAGETSIDSMQAATLLFWAARVTGDAKTKDAAHHHADRILALHLRADDSFIQSTSIDPRNGTVLRHYTHKGCSDTSTWGRAQAWGTLFSIQSYLHDPSQPRWLEGAMRGADWWMAHVPDDRIAYWDFDDPKIPAAERDTAATAIATAALLRLAVVAPDSRRAVYQNFAEKSAEALIGDYLTPTYRGDRRVRGMLTGACFNKRADARPHDAASNCEFIVGDYYLFESLLALTGRINPTEL
jgi:unsaturated chondroitin disaccharide hydrolase